MMKFILATVCLLAQGAALASSPEYIEGNSAPQMEFTIALGTALQTGYLTSDHSENTYAFGLHFVTPRGLWAFDFQGFKAKHDTNEFTLANNQSVGVHIFSLTPYFMPYSSDNFDLLLGVGLNHVTLVQDTPEYNTTYGTFGFSGMLRYRYSPKLSLHYRTSWTGVTQTVNEAKTSFEFWSHMAGIGFEFR